MDQERWSEVDRYIVDLFVGEDPVLDRALADSRAAGLPPINVSPNLGKLLHLLARVQGARRVLEVGTLGGYSTIWLGRALAPGGHLDTLEIDPGHAAVAERNLDRAGLTGVVTVHLGRAVDTLARLASEGVEPYDLVFIDADKQSNAEYFDWALRLARPGSLVIVDNVVRQGAVVDAATTDPAVAGTRRLNEAMAADGRVAVTEIQTVGSKGYDGFALALVLET